MLLLALILCFSGCTSMRIPSVTYKSHIRIVPCPHPYADSAQGSAGIPTNGIYLIDMHITRTQHSKTVTIVSRRSLMSYTNSFVRHEKYISYFGNTQPPVTLKWDVEAAQLDISTEIVDPSIGTFTLEQNLYLPYILSSLTKEPTGGSGSGRCRGYPLEVRSSTKISP